MRSDSDNLGYSADRELKEYFRREVEVCKRTEPPVFSAGIRWQESLWSRLADSFVEFAVLLLIVFVLALDVEKSSFGTALDESATFGQAGTFVIQTTNDWLRQLQF